MKTHLLFPPPGRFVDQYRLQKVPRLGAGSYGYLISCLFLILLAFAAIPAHAQQIQGGAGAPALDFEVANGPRTFTVTILDGTVATGTLTVTLPTGSTHLCGSTPRP